MKTVWNYFISLKTLYNVKKRYICSVVPPTNLAQAISSILSPKIQLWPKWRQKQQNWMWHGLGVMQTVRKYYISLILSYKVRKYTYFFRCTANQVVSVHKLHFHHKLSVRAKLAAINNKNDCDTAGV